MTNALLFVSTLLTGGSSANSPAELSLPLSDLAQDALVMKSTQRWRVIDRDRSLRTHERLWALLRTRPILRVKRDSGALFVDIVVSNEGQAIIYDGFANGDCTLITPPTHYERNSYFYDKAVWVYRLEITTKWAAKWKPLPYKSMISGVDSSHARAWSVWVKKRIGMPALKPVFAKQRKPSESDWGYRELDRGDMNLAVAKAGAIGHAMEIELLEEQAKVIAESWKRREQKLATLWRMAAAHADFPNCASRAKTRNWTNDAQYQHCREVIAEERRFYELLTNHRATRLSTYRTIRRMRQAVEFHRRGLAEAKAVVKELTTK